MKYAQIEFMAPHIKMDTFFMKNLIFWILSDNWYMAIHNFHSSLIRSYFFFKTVWNLNPQRSLSQCPYFKMLLDSTTCQLPGGLWSVGLIVGLLLCLALWRYFWLPKAFEFCRSPLVNFVCSCSKWGLKILSSLINSNI